MTSMGHCGKRVSGRLRSTGSPPGHMWIRPMQKHSQTAAWQAPGVEAAGGRRQRRPPGEPRDKPPDATGTGSTEPGERTSRACWWGGAAGARDGAFLTGGLPGRVLGKMSNFWWAEKRKGASELIGPSGWETLRGWGAGSFLAMPGQQQVSSSVPSPSQVLPVHSCPTQLPWNQSALRSLRVTMLTPTSRGSNELTGWGIGTCHTLPRGFLSQPGRGGAAWSDPHCSRH